MTTPPKASVKAQLSNHERVNILQECEIEAAEVQTLTAGRPQTPLLDTINTPQDLRKLKPGDLHQVAQELRNETVDAVSVTGGHLGAGLGVVELTVALHYVFNTPDDIVIWDVGHQAYPHKILTGRRDRIRTLRQGGGLSRFYQTFSESEYDRVRRGAQLDLDLGGAFGYAVGRDLKKQKEQCHRGDRRRFDQRRHGI